MDTRAVRRTASPFGCLTVAEMAVTTNCPETVFDLTTLQVGELNGDESARGGYEERRGESGESSGPLIVDRDSREDRSS